MLLQTAELFMRHVTADVSVVANIFAAKMSCGHKNADGAIKTDGANKHAQMWWMDFFLKIQNLLLLGPVCLLPCLFTLSELCKLALQISTSISRAVPSWSAHVKTCQDGNFGRNSVCNHQRYNIQIKSCTLIAPKSHMEPTHYANSS